MGIDLRYSIDMAGGTAQVGQAKTGPLFSRSLIYVVNIKNEKLISLVIIVTDNGAGNNYTVIVVPQDHTI